MKKQTTIYLDERNTEKLQKIKEVMGADTNSEVFRNLIKEEFERIEKYKNM